LNPTFGLTNLQQPFILTQIRIIKGSKKAIVANLDGLASAENKVTAPVCLIKETLLAAEMRLS
jgi:hypothetical protein